MITIEELSDMAAKYWMKTGKTPTHVLMTTEQQMEISNFMKPKERLVLGQSSPSDSRVTVIHLARHIVLDVIPVSALIAGNTHNIDFPKLLTIEEE